MEPADLALAEPIMPEPDRPPSKKLSATEWAKENLFYNVASTLITLGFVVIFVALLKNTIRFVFVSGRWEILHVNMTNMLVGVLFPREEITRGWIALFIVAMGVAFMVGSAHQLVAQSDEELGAAVVPQGQQMRSALGRFAPMVLLVVVLLALARQARFGAAALIFGMVAVGWVARTVGMRLPRQRAGLGAAAGGLTVVGGFVFLATGVGWQQWGGLLLTVFLASSAIVLCFPLGLAAALGRRSKLPVVRAFSIIYIELIRGVPLITLLFIGSLTLNFFLPAGLVPSGVTRSVIMITLFSGAYVAEIVRGGLQAVPKGQTEAAQALGLPTLKMLRLIVLPQALRNVIPALVGQFISLFKDTSLVAIIGLRDLLLVTQGFTKQPEFQGTAAAEVLAIAAFIYWVFTFTMSRESQRLERRLGVGTR